MPILKRLFIAMIMAFMMPISSGLAAELNVYSYRVPQLLQPFLDAYTAETGTQFNVVHAPKGLAQRLQSEGAGSPADVVLTVDISRIAELENMGLLSPLNSDVINQRVPAHLRDDGGTWTALSTRARVIVVSKTRVQEGEITRIEDLAKPEWKGRICSRKGSHVYNRALLASLVVHLGEEAAEDWAKAYVDNLAKRPQGNDRAQAKSIYAGECDVALMNTYYYGAMANNTKNPEQQDWAKAIRMVFFNQDDRGQHINISAGGVVKSSPHQDEARAFLEWMTGPTAQRIYAEVNAEYPVNADVAPDPSVAAWGVFKADDVSIEAIGRASSTAQMIIDRTGW
ncbi:MAG: extracellular solute-binding protein [Alphaproteobacteria bacterium]